MAPKTYTLLSGGYSGRIETLTFTPREKALVVKSKISSAGKGPTWLEVSKKHGVVYALDEWAEGSGEAYALKLNEDGSLDEVPLSKATTNGLWPCHGNLSNEEDALFTITYKGATVSRIAIEADGTLGKNTFVQADLEKDLGPHKGRQEAAHPHGAHADPSGNYLVVPDLGTDQLRVYDISTKEIVDVEAFKLGPADGPRHVLFGATTGTVSLLYVLNELGNSVSVLTFDVATPGKPKLVVLQQGLSILPPKPFAHQADFSGWHAAELALMPDGKFLFATNRAEGHDPLNAQKEGPGDIVAVFPVAADGTLSTEGKYPLIFESSGRAPRHFSFSPDGKYVAFAYHDSDAVVIHEVNADGSLSDEVAKLDPAGHSACVRWL